MLYDVIIVGGGPAGLSAATILGRARRRVILFDDGRYRNHASRGVHGFLTRDGVHPAELRRIAREQLERYDVEIRCARVAAVAICARGFQLTLDDGAGLECRRLLLATGVEDEVPDIPGVDRFYGNGVFHCPYCDGWEVRDQALVAYGKAAAGLAASLRGWSSDVVLCTGGPATVKPAEAARLERLGVPVERRPIARLEGRDFLEQIAFDD